MNVLAPQRRSRAARATVCLGKRLLAPRVYELRLRKPEGFRFEPGQFVLFDVPSPGVPRDVQPRAYSIASAPCERELLFVIKLVPGGRASRWIEEVVGPGTDVVMRGPFGALLLDRLTDKPYLFIATGTGVAPFRSQILATLGEGGRRRVDLLAGFPSEGDFFWAGQWKALEGRHANFRAHASFLSGGPDWHGGAGTLQERARRLVTDPSGVSVYLCGAPETVNGMKQLCLSLGVPARDVHAERYT